MITSTNFLITTIWNWSFDRCTRTCTSCILQFYHKNWWTFSQYSGTKTQYNRWQYFWAFGKDKRLSLTAERKVLSLPGGKKKGNALLSTLFCHFKSQRGQPLPFEKSKSNYYSCNNRHMSCALSSDWFSFTILLII